MARTSKLRAVKIIGVAVFNIICVFSIIYCVAMNLDKRQADGAQGDEVRVIKDFQAPAIARGQSPEVTVPSPAAPQAQAPAPATARGQSPEVTVPSPAAPAPVSPQPAGDRLLVDDFQGDETKNKLGSRANVYSRAPSRVMVARRDDTVNGRKVKVLMIKYDKRNTGGPNGMGGWCGYYTLIKDEKAGRYLSGLPYKYITFWARGEQGGENFMMGLADEHWDKIGDSLKAEEIGVYLEKGKITTQWQKAKVPLDAFFLDQANLSSISINFEADCFPEGASAGVVYISDIALEK